RRRGPSLVDCTERELAKPTGKRRVERRKHDKRPRIVAPAGRPRHVHEHITLPAYLAVEKLPALIVANTAHQQPSRKACPLHYHYHVATQLPFLNRSHGLH
ncbi:hypothetical protein FOZ62_022668, partial [Perkinsus olseni]